MCGLGGGTGERVGVLSYTTDTGRCTMAQTKERVYTEAEIGTKIQELGLTGWYLEEGWLRRKYNTDGWPQTLMAVNAIGYLCEAAYHHADLAVTWGKLWVKLQTHSAGGITDKDFEMAKKIEEVVLWRPTGGALGTGNPHKFVFHKS
jgi:4a-hydroxytetrahydrobiopterin dehydratase